MYNAIEFERVATEANEWREGAVFISPNHVVKVEPFATRQTVDSLITLSKGHPETVVGPPSEVNTRLRRGL